MPPTNSQLKINVITQDIFKSHFLLVKVVNTSIKNRIRNITKKGMTRTEILTPNHFNSQYLFVTKFHTPDFLEDCCRQCKILLVCSCPLDDATHLRKKKNK